MEKLRQGIASLNYNELKIMEKDLKKGAPVIKSLIKRRINQLETQDTGICAGCGSKEHLQFTLIFGPEDFKKKASFCAMDCLEHFILQLRELNR